MASKGLRLPSVAGKLFIFVAVIKQNSKSMKKITVNMERKGLTLQASREDMALSLKTYRLRRGQTQQQLAEEWGVSRFTIMKIEKGKPVSWEIAYRIFANLSEGLLNEGRK